ncbi:hypothetical protein [Edaphobacillus lindanitolerans]|uniref:Uncharacterized protein n=1 Tax=Edaphobacillus lindanitolerans TaxID=550447 RepID=A0A1U7PLQ7_9BACI|nr:hypothetical protein [Edaphobacillus lindanitolerans]SIT75095.1 hypothetical protein SAMN05428946_1133 [Edaphobacillus lindanitolerans]
MTAWEMEFRRKIIAASLAGTVFAVLLGLFVPNMFDETIRSAADYLWHMTSSIPIYLMYSFPVILIYGVPASLAADHIAGKLAVRIGKRTAEPWLSGALHLVFGLPLFWYGAAAGLLGFMADRLIRSWRKTHRWYEMLTALLIPLLVWVVFMGLIYLWELPEQLPALLK